jgi:hypothetical protein
LGGSVHTIRKNTEALLIANKEIGLEVNAEKTKYMVMSRDQNTGQNGYIQIGNEWFETVELFKYLGTTLTNQNSIHAEIKSRLKSGNACYHSVQKLLSSSLLSKNVKIKIYRTIMLPVVLYGCESWSLTLREECRLRVFENKVLRRISGPKRDEALYFIRTCFFVMIVLHFAFCLYLWHTTQTFMPSAGFEPAIPASDRPHTVPLDCSAAEVSVRVRFLEIISRTPKYKYQ